MASQDTEITLGTGKMLALFFGLVALNGAFFGMGYSLGRAGAHSALTLADQSQPGSGPVLRPSAMKSGGSSVGTQATDSASPSKTTDQKDAGAPTSSPATAATGSPRARQPHPTPSRLTRRRTLRRFFPAPTMLSRWPLSASRTTPRHSSMPSRRSSTPHSQPIPHQPIGFITCR
jgi:DedD protein